MGTNLFTLKNSQTAISVYVKIGYKVDNANCPLYDTSTE